MAVRPDAGGQQHDHGADAERQVARERLADAHDRPAPAAVGQADRGGQHDATLGDAEEVERVDRPASPRPQRVREQQVDERHQTDRHEGEEDLALLGIRRAGQAAGDVAENGLVAHRGLTFCMWRM
jgi:hypothetical protein